MRSEAQAPFRVARMFLFGAFTANAGLGFGIASSRRSRRRSARPPSPSPGPVPAERRDQPRVRSILRVLLQARRGGEGPADGAHRPRGRLGALRCQLVGGKSVSCLTCAASPASSSPREAPSTAPPPSGRGEPPRRSGREGVLLVPVVLEPPSNGPSPVPEASEADKRFRAAPLRGTSGGRGSRAEREAKLGDATGVNVGLRMDGRVRSSGTGIPPWDRFAKELPPTDSWGGVMDGFDGRVGVDT